METGFITVITSSFLLCLSFYCCYMFIETRSICKRYCFFPDNHFCIIGITVIDVCPRNGNLLALSSEDGYVRIFDKRSSRIFKNWKSPYSGNYPGEFTSVRWSPNGDMLASTLHDTSVTLWSFPAGTVVPTQRTRDWSKPIPFNNIYYDFIVRWS